MNTPNPVGRRSVDEAALVRGASAGFTVLLFGELLAPFASGINATLGLLWLSLVGAAGYVAAGSKIGIASMPALHGAFAALGALVLTIPLRLFVGASLEQQWYALLVSAMFGLGVGALAGRASGQLRDRQPSA